MDDHCLRLRLQQSKKSMAANKCTSIAGHVNGHGYALEQYGANRPNQHCQGFTGSHWTPPSGNYSLRIDPAAARTTANKTTMQNVPTSLAVFVDASVIMP